MKKTAVLEGIMISLIGVICLTEGFRLTLNVDPKALTDVVGPGLYILVLSIVLLATGIFHIIIHYKTSISVQNVSVDKELRKRMISMAAVFAIYICLMSVLGYYPATIIFFLFEFRIVGIKSWLTNIILTFVMTTTYYVVFIYYCEMIFPRGILF